MSDETWRYESNARETLHAIHHILNQWRSTLDDISLNTQRTDEWIELIRAVNEVGEDAGVIAKNLSKLDIDLFTTEQELASISGHLREVVDALTDLRTEQSALLSNAFFQKGLWSLWEYSIPPMAIGMFVIIATLRHWF
jgi:hypothetical protein